MLTFDCFCSGHPLSRFAYGLLSKLLDYVEGAMSTVREDKPSRMFSRHQNLTQTSEDMKPLVRVVLPLLERYFNTCKSYFIEPYSGASIEEKKMATMLFTRPFTLLRLRTRCSGAHVNVTVSCLKCLIECLDIKAIVQISYAEDFVRVRLMPFFSLCADDLNLIIRNLNSGRYSHIKGTIRRGVCSVDYLHMILLPTLKTMFEHISKTGVDLLQETGEILSSLHKIIDDIVHLAGACSSGNQELRLIEVTLPMLYSYLPVWWRKILAQRQDAHRLPSSKAASFFPDYEELLAAVDAEGGGLLT
ncbi:Ryanodine receptor, partial [Taenia solium]